MNWRSFAAFLLVVYVREFPMVCGHKSQATASLDRSLSDRKFTTSELFERDGLSELRCAALCMQTDHCATFTCTLTEDRLCQCRGYQGRKTPSDPYEGSPETAAYVSHIEDTSEETTPEDTTQAVPETTTEEVTTAKADWSNITSCSADAYCTEPNSSCRNGRCMCVHGYYYSVGAKVCQEDCPLADLQNTYLLYEGVGIIGYNDATLYFFTLEQCISRCDEDGACLHFEYTDAERCYISYTNTRQLTLSPDDWSHYQRNCA